MKKNPKNKHTARVQTWAKGFRVSEMSQEFQLIVPPSKESLDDSERLIGGSDWGKVLHPLYRLSGALDREFAVLHDAECSAFTVAAAAHSEDRGGRPSIVIVASTVDTIDEPTTLATALSKAWSLSRRLADAYASALSGAPTEIEKQLRDDRFLAERVFTLDDEQPSTTVAWQGLESEFARWTGIRGVATKNLLTLGANVLYGTRDEAERNRAVVMIDGYFDATRHALVPLTKSLRQVPEPATEKVPSQQDKKVSLAEIRIQLERMEQRQNDTFSVVQELYDTIRRVLSGDDSGRY